MPEKQVTTTSPEEGRATDTLKAEPEIKRKRKKKSAKKRRGAATADEGVREGKWSTVYMLDQ